MKQKLSIFMWVVFFTAVVTWLSLAEYTAELRNAYDWAFNYKITTQPSIDEARLDGEITRQSLAKMMVVFSESLLWATPDTSLKCNFKDEDAITEDLRTYAKEACQLWIMGQWDSYFDPMWKVTRAQFWTILSRALWWDTYEGSDPYYLAHMVALQEEWILKDIADPENSNIKRGEVMTALMRSTNGIWYWMIGFSEYIEEEDYYNYDPEIESLMDLINFTEKEKGVIRWYLEEIWGWFLWSVYSKVDELGEWFNDDEWDYSNAISWTIEKLNSLKGEFNNYIKNIKTIYKALNVDITVTSPYTPWEFIKKTEELSNKLSELIDCTLDYFYLLKEICDDWYCDFEFPSDEIEEWYKAKALILKDKYDKVSIELDEANEKYQEYLYEYKLWNKYWRDYQDSLLDLDTVAYNPKDAVSISWYLVWEDLTRYQWDIKDWKMEWKGILAYWKYYYSGEWKNNMANGYWEFKGNWFSYEWTLRNFKYDGFWVLKLDEENSIYTWEWLNWEKHWKGEYTSNEYYFSWEWKFDEPINWKLILTDWVTYEWTFEDEEYHGKWKLTLISKDVYEWEFRYGSADWLGKLTLTNGEVYSWEWDDWYLSGQGVYIKDWKVILWSKIDIIDNQWNDTIVITDWSDTLTIMNKNIGATEVWTWEASYGSVFKWWNNTPFNSLDTWDSKAFLKASTWEWKEKDQWPCPKGYHIPTVNEWEWIVNMWKLKNNIDYLSSWDVVSLMNTLKLPFAWYRYWIKLIDSESFSWSIEDIKEIINEWFALRYSKEKIYNAWRFRSSSVNSNYYINGDPGYMFYWFTTLNNSAENNNFYEYSNNIWLNDIAYPIRCFKD